MATAQQITEELIERFIKEEGAAADSFEEIADYLEDQLGAGKITIASGDLELVEQFGGECEGDDYWLVVKLGSQFFKFEGFHDSWNGVNWDESKLKEVEAREVTVVQYFYK